MSSSDAPSHALIQHVPSKSPLDKVDHVVKMFIWTQVLIITVALCIPSIIIALQYSGDTCVIGEIWNVRLDEWLLVAALLQLISIISFLPSVCCVWKHCCSRMIPLILIGALMIWIGLGIFILTQSDLNSCQHDSLFVMSVIETSFICVFIIIYAMVQIYSCCYCNCCSNARNDEGPRDRENVNNKCCGFCGFKQQYRSLSDNEEEIEQLKWFREQSLRAFAVSSPEQ